MSKAMDLAEAQWPLDRDRKNVDETARRLRDYCKALRERIARYYGCMAIPSKHTAMILQRAKMGESMDFLDDLLAYMQDGEDMEGGPWVQIDRLPMSEEQLAELQLESIARALARTGMNTL